jgi:septum site-determining protein MinC
MRRRVIAALGVHRTTHPGRRWLSNPARVAAAKQYLEGWVGSKTTPSLRVSTSQHTSPLLLSGSSYLLATLRLEKTDTPNSIAQRLQEEHPVVSKTQWKCPIVLDLRAWGPDGSPHHRPPAAGTLLALVHLLDRHGLAVVGVNGTPKELEREAIQDLGLPSLYSKQSTRDVPKYALEEVIQMVVRRQQQQQQQQQEPIEEYEPRVVEVAENTSTKMSAEEEQESEHSTIESEVEEKSQTEKVVNDSVPASLPPVPPTATFYQGSVRSGQQVTSEKGQSLVILGSVSSGGEVLSDGDIFVLGKLRGRALAGLACETARVVSTSMDPELICIGSVLSTIENIEEFGIPSGSPAVVSLNHNRQLEFSPITLG